MFQIGVCYAEMGPDPAACRIFIPLRNGVTFRSGIEQVNRETQACVTITIFHAWNTFSAIMRISDEKGPAETEENKKNMLFSSVRSTSCKNLDYSLARGFEVCDMRLGVQQPLVT